MIEALFTRHAKTYWYTQIQKAEIDPATGKAGEGPPAIFNISAIPLPVDERLVASGEAKATDQDLIVNAVDFGTFEPLPGDFIDEGDKQWTLLGAEPLHWTGGTEFYRLHVRAGG